jgi:carboxylesterase
MIVKLIAAGLAGAVGAGAAYPAWTRMRAARRERRESFDGDGVRAGMQAFSVGEGRVALVLLHGFASGPSVFRFLAPTLAEAGFACRVPRLPGFGERVERMCAVREGDWRLCALSEIERARAGRDAVWLVGHSMGGTLALDLAQTHPGLVEGVVLLAPLIEVSARRSFGLPPERMFRAVSRLLPGETILGTAFPVDLHARADGVDELRDRFLPLSMYAAMFRLVADVRARPRALPVPALMVVPGSDKVVSRRASREYFDSLRAPRKLLVEDAEAGHVVPLDYGWREIAAAIDAFVRGESDARVRARVAAPAR